MHASIHFTHEDGHLSVLTHYEGGFDEALPAHQAAFLLTQRMQDIAQPAGPAEIVQPEHQPTALLLAR